MDKSDRGPNWDSEPKPDLDFHLHLEALLPHSLILYIELGFPSVTIGYTGSCRITFKRHLASYLALITI